jgi:glycosyltransferase involved in cell wall biosynthesis
MLPSGSKSSLVFVSTTADDPLVSVIIPAYNAEQFIAKTLHSVLQQTYPNLEVVVVDDGSSDRTVEIVQSFASEDARIILFCQANAGVAVARNWGITQSKGEFIAPIDADDLWHPQNLEKQVACMQELGSAVGVVYSWSVDIDERDAVTGGFHVAAITGDVYYTLLCHNFLGNASATLIRRICLEQVGGYDPQLKVQNAQGCEDWDLYLRLAQQYAFAAVPEFLVGYRKLQESMSCDYLKMARSHHFMLQAAKRRDPKIPEALCKLSSSSFYLYLAHQCGNLGATSRNKIQAEQQPLFWLWQALKVDVSPLLRPKFYSLLFQISLRVFKQKILNQVSRYTQKNTLQENSQKIEQEITYPDMTHQPIWERSVQPLESSSRVKLKLLGGNMLHLLIRKGTLRQSHLSDPSFKTYQ